MERCCGGGWYSTSKYFLTLITAVVRGRGLTFMAAPLTPDLYLSLPRPLAPRNPHDSQRRFGALSFRTTFHPVCWRGTETNQVDWISYDGWGMHVPEGYFRFATGPDKFVEELRRLGGEDDVRQWCVLAFCLFIFVELQFVFCVGRRGAKNFCAVCCR